MGQRPPKVAAMAEYLRVVRGLLAGERVDFTVHGKTASIQFLLTDYKFVDISRKIPIYLSAFGPKVQALAGQFADGMIISMPRVARLEEALAHVRTGAERAGRSLEGFYTGLFRSVVVLEPGEAANSERIVRESGPSIMATVHYLYEKLRKTGGEPPSFVRPIWKRFCALFDGVPEDVLHFKLHQGHSTFLPPEEAELITEELVRATCLIGRPEELVEHFRGLEREGIAQFMFQPPVEYQFRIVENFSRKVMRLM
jgi:alkanesulfonate monooxygenase SsuD/methylene tetrahydromethanopterin reductase-like flavin-dependent oxidoreductase (luciferase family)